MYCETYHIKMDSKYCLLYQARSRGTAEQKDKMTNGGPRGILVIWAQKYQPCLTCEQGKEVRENGGNENMDKDVEALKKLHGSQIAELPKESGPGQICTSCQVPKPLSEFYESVAGSGKHVKVYKDCTKTRVAAQAVAKRHGGLIASKTNSNPALTSNAGGRVCEICRIYQIADNFPGGGGICGVCQTKIPPGGKSEIEEKPILLTCERCGWTGPSKNFHIAGINGPINVCRQCIVKKRLANKEDRLKNTVEISPQSVILDFSEYPEFLENLKADARRNFRTLQNEILFRVISNHV